MQGFYVDTQMDWCWQDAQTDRKVAMLMENRGHPDKQAPTIALKYFWFVCLCWGLTSQSTIFQSCRDGATASWVINQYFRGEKCLAQGHNTAAVGIEPPTSRSGVRHSTTEPPRSPEILLIKNVSCYMYLLEIKESPISVEQMWVFDDNWRIIFVSSP